MTDLGDLYPPNPTGVPEGLTRPPGSYRTRVVLVLLGLVAFAGLYLGLAAGSAYACVRCVAWLAADEPPAPRGPGRSAGADPPGVRGLAGGDPGGG